MDHFDQEENSQSATVENPPSLSAEDTAEGGGEGTGSSLPDLEQVDSVQGTLLFLYSLFIVSSIATQDSTLFSVDPALCL